ncbi:MAG: EamA family transporter [Clostridia bacterium]|nr:EamA family transporter [Clostridia bacterium]
MINKYVLLLLSSVFIAACSQILLKKSAKEEHSSKIKEYLNLKVIVGYGMMFASTIFSILGFRGLDYKNGPIIEAFGYIFIMILSRIFLKEKITTKKVIGNSLIILGIIVFYI